MIMQYNIGLIQNVVNFYLEKWGSSPYVSPFRMVAPQNVGDSSRRGLIEVYAYDDCLIRFLDRLCF